MIIYCVTVSYTHLDVYKRLVYEVDPSAFITIQDVHDVFGGRFTKSGH